jgi:hypothetical protein
VIRFGLRLTLRGGREAVVRLVVTAAAVALGTGMLLVTLAAINAVNTQNARYAWLNSTDINRPAGSARATAADPLWWLLQGDYFDGQQFGRLDVAATGPASPVPPGIARLPGPGQFYASPALSRLLRSVPAAQLGDRFPGRQIGTIGPSALPAPNSLIVIIGHTASQLSREPGASRLTSILGTVPSSCHGCYLGINANGIDLIFAITAGALLFPVLVFITTATRMSAARREQRFAAMRLVGATPRQVSVISAVESTVAAAVGAGAGFALFFLFRDPAATIPFTGAPFFPSDLSLSLADVLPVALGVPVAAAVAARIALRRVQISPLGVSRRVTPRAPRAYRLIPLLAGIAELVCLLGITHPKTSTVQIAVYLPGFVVIMVGLIIAGPWLTMVGSRLMARRASRPATLIAARRLADNPRAGFRAISGLVLALFVTSVAVGVITSIDANRGPAGGGPAARDTLLDQFADRSTNPPSIATPPTPAGLLAGLHSIQGVQGVTVIHTDPLGVALPDAQLGLPSGWGPVPTGLVSCAQLTRTPALGRCPAGAVAAAIPSQVLLPGHSSSDAGFVWPAAAISAPRLQHLPAQSITVSTNGSVSAIEQARTALEAGYPGWLPTTISEFRQGPKPTLAGWQQLANVVILVSLAIAGCTLAASVATGLTDRKRPFSLLRLTGVPLGMLRRIIALETAVPLLIVAAISAGTGFLAAQLFLSSQLDYSLLAPGVEYYLIVVGGLAVSLGIIAFTLPLLKRITGPETARNE